MITLFEQFLTVTLSGLEHAIVFAEWTGCRHFEFIPVDHSSV